MDPYHREDGSGVHAAQRDGEVRGTAHRLPGSRLPQHLRVLGGPRGHLPHRRRAVHPPVRLLPDRHRQAGRPRPRRASPGRRVGAADGPALLDHHRCGPRRPRRRRRVALRRDHPSGARPEPGHRRRDPRPRLQRHPRAGRPGHRRPPRGVGAQRRDGAADLQADPPRVPLRALPRRHHHGPRRRPGDEVQPHPRDGRGGPRDRAGPSRPPRGRDRHHHHHPVPAPLAAPPPRRPLGEAGGVRPLVRGR